MSSSSPASQFGPNEWLVEEMYEQFLADPSSVDSAWHDFFADYKPTQRVANEAAGDTKSNTKTATVAKTTKPTSTPPPKASEANNGQAKTAPKVAEPATTSPNTPVPPVLNG